MTFVLRQKRYVKRVVKGVCGDDPYEFTAHIKVLSDRRTRELRKELTAAQRLVQRLENEPELELVNAQGEDIVDLDRRIAIEVLGGWGDDYVNENGDPIPFNEANKMALLDEEGLATNIAGVWAGTYQESLKNSASSQPSGADLSSDQTQKD